MIATRLLVELGWKPHEAVSEVRRVRPGAIETDAKLQYCLAPPTEFNPHRDAGAEAVEDRAIGCLLGLAVGDALGTTLEFSKRDAKPRLMDRLAWREEIEDLAYGLYCPSEGRQPAN